MTDLVNAPHQDFEKIKKLDENGIEFWEARELMPLLGYLQWKNFKPVIEKAKIACQKSGQIVISHFSGLSKMVDLGSGSRRNIEDYKLSRYACYLIAQNGDPAKQSIANAQTYFAIQARRQELFQTLEEDAKRLYIREEVKKQNKKLFSTASKAGVRDFGKFNNLGYLGLYGLSIPKIKRTKGIIKKDDILDRAGSTELAANLFRITQTDDKIKRENIVGQGKASFAHYVVGSTVRNTIKELGGTMPEKLPSQTHIKKLRPGQQKLIK